MILDHINSYRNKFTNKAKSKNYYVNCNEENNNDINIYPNLRYDNYNNDNTLNYINENNIYPKKMIILIILIKIILLECKKIDFKNLV